MDCREELDMWTKKWESAQKKWAQDAPQPQSPTPKSNNFFGLQTNSLPSDTISAQDKEHWADVYVRSNQISEEQPRQEDQVFQEEAQGWRKLLGKSQQIKPRPQQQNQPMPSAGKQSFHEQAEGWRKLLTTPGKSVNFQVNPQYPPSIGMDQGDSPYEPTRVAPNFTDGAELRELNDLKVKLERLESSLLSNEIKAGKANVDRNDYKTALDNLRKQIDKLSDKLQPDPGNDPY